MDWINRSLLDYLKQATVLRYLRENSVDTGDRTMFGNF